MRFPADHFAPIVQHTRDTVFGETVEIVLSRALAFDGKQGGEGFTHDRVIVETEQRLCGAALMERIVLSAAIRTTPSVAVSTMARISATRA